MNRILIIDSNSASRKNFFCLLKEEGYEVDCASYGTEGLRMLAEQNYALVISDLIMQDISGMDILSRVREIDPGIDVLMVTGNANLESAIFALKHGARDYLIKPVNPDEFRHSVAQCLEQRRILDENEELKNMLSLFQASQTIAGCLEIDRLYHLLTDAVAREMGVNRAMGLFQEENRLEVKAVKGMTAKLADNYRDTILSNVIKRLPQKHLMTHIRFHCLTKDMCDASIQETFLIFVRRKDYLLFLTIRKFACPNFNHGKKTYFSCWIRHRFLTKMPRPILRQRICSSLMI